MELDHATAAKFDAVIARVKEPQSELTLAELGLIKKFTYHEKERTIVAHLNFGTPAYECAACYAVNEYVIKTIERDLKAALEEEFPGWTIQFAQGNEA